MINSINDWETKIKMHVLKESGKLQSIDAVMHIPAGKPSTKIKPRILIVDS